MEFVGEDDLKVFFQKSDTVCTQMKGLYRSACIIGKKQEEMEPTLQLESYSLIAVAETGQGESHDWNIAVNGWKL